MDLMVGLGNDDVTWGAGLAFFSILPVWCSIQSIWWSLDYSSNFFATWNFFVFQCNFMITNPARYIEILLTCKVFCGISYFYAILFTNLCTIVFVYSENMKEIESNNKNIQFYIFNQQTMNMLILRHLPAKDFGLTIILLNGRFSHTCQAVLTICKIYTVNSR